MNTLNTLVVFCQSLEKMYPTSSFDEITKTLQGIRSKIQGSVGPSLTLQEFDKIEVIRKYLSSKSEFESKLLPLSDLCLQIAKGLLLYLTVKVDVSNINNNKSKFTAISAATREARNAVMQNPTDIRSIMTVMLLLTGRKETFYHATKDILKSGMKQLNLNNYDIEELCSVQSKVYRITKDGVAFDSDIEAIRNCIGHAYYDIKKQVDGSYIVRFERHDMGYNYVKEFTDKEFVKFFSDYLLFEILLTMILNMSLAQAMMLRFLVNYPKNKNITF